jgi:uncharacterized protein (UPF0335 family)
MTNQGNISSDQLRQYIARIEKLNEEKSDITSAIRDIYAEAKSQGFDVKAMRHIVKLLKKRADERAEEEYLIDLYKRALGIDSVD